MFSKDEPSMIRLLIYAFIGLFRATVHGTMDGPSTKTARNFVPTLSNNDYAKQKLLCGAADALQYGAQLRLCANETVRNRDRSQPRLRVTEESPQPRFPPLSTWDKLNKLNEIIPSRPQTMFV